MNGQIDAVRTIRRARPDDAESVVRILRQAPQPPQELPEDDRDAVGRFRHQFEAHAEPGPNGFWVVQRGGQVVGMVQLVPPVDAEQDDETLEVSIYLAPDEQQAGLGTRLVKNYVRPWLADAEVRVLTATPTTRAATRLLLATGFCPRGAEADPDRGVRQLWEGLVNVPWDLPTA